MAAINLQNIPWTNEIGHYWKLMIRVPRTAARSLSLSLSRFWRKAQGNHDIKFDWIHNTSHIITHTKIKIHQVSHFYTFLPFSLWNRVPRWFLCPMAHHGQLPARAQDLLPLWHQGLATGRDDNEDSMRTLWGLYEDSMHHDSHHIIE